MTFYQAEPRLPSQVQSVTALGRYQLFLSVVELRKKQWGTTPRRHMRRDFDAVYYMGSPQPQWGESFRTPR